MTGANATREPPSGPSSSAGHRWHHRTPADLTAVSTDTSHPSLPLPGKRRGWPPLAPATGRPLFMGQVESQPSPPVVECSPPAGEPSLPSPAPASSSLEALAAGVCCKLKVRILWVGFETLLLDGALVLVEAWPTVRQWYSDFGIF
jgi:hypothetical protein